MSNLLGRKLQFEIFGESHGPCVGGVLSGLMPGIRIDRTLLLHNVSKRRPGSSEYVTSRNETDAVEFLSGLVDDVTTGAPVAFIIRNENQQSKDYSHLHITPRPSHADYAAFHRYKGYNDVRGGGHFSGRLTAAVVVAGSIAEQINTQENIRVYSHLQKIGPFKDRSFYDNLEEEDYKNAELSLFQTIDPALTDEIKTFIHALKAEGDSAGGVVETVIYGLNPGLGDPFFGSVESQLASALYSIPGVKGLEFGKGFDICSLSGSEANDVLQFEGEEVVFHKNYSGGINGGITNGAPVVFNLAFRPTVSISKPQMTVDLKEKTNKVLEIVGRHDPAFVLRAPVVVKAMTHLVILEMRMNA